MNRGPMQDSDLLQQLRTGDRSALGRAITLVESTRAADRSAARELVRGAMQVPARSLRIGITGIPGVGKSTLIDALGSDLTQRGQRVAVLAIDPSSVRNAGSILGDKTRMVRLAGDERAFVRPSPSGGHLGGVARRTREAVVLCEAAGYDRILIETVGVGQSEAAVDQLTDLNLLLMIGGAGDSLQGIKRGIMESADLVAINKTDGDNEQRNQRASMDLRQAIALLPPRESGLRPEVLLCSATTSKGISKLADELERIGQLNRDNGYLQVRRQEQARWWMRSAIEEALIEGFYSNERVSNQLRDYEERVRQGLINPFDAAQELLRLYGQAT